ncbi:putative zinc-binding [Phaeomoniella chlamydospora]|uniref:Putative zinc-binding n=1 Tax=Phaeomoniella chlamydospora TaxID=158046 RepID=A0A0G2H8T4_PHACM|nr:putative zinc-binding [Phaeomoniella chlamydospora]
MPHIPSTMRAAVLSIPGGPEVLQIKDLPVPSPAPSEILIRIHTAGLNRSELFTCRGDSGPAVPLPRVLGIECVGTVAAEGSATSTPLKEGDIVATAMGGLGRTFDGGYAEYTCVPASHIAPFPANSDRILGWPVLGAIPEMIQTAYGSLQNALRFSRNETLLIRGGTTSVGLAAASLAKWMGAKHVIATSRSLTPDRVALMKESGVDTVLQDSGSIAPEIQALFSSLHANDSTPDGGGCVVGVDKVLELVGITTLRDSLLCARKGGIVCVTGIVGNRWFFEKGTNPMEFIPSEVLLTTYSGGLDAVKETPFEEIVTEVMKGRVNVQVGRTFRLEDVVEAHTAMEENRVGGWGVLIMD